MNHMITDGVQTSFVFRIPRSSFSKEERFRTMSGLKINIDLSLLKEYEYEERTFEVALATLANLKGSITQEKFGAPIKSSVEKLGFFLPDPAEVASFLFYNARKYGDNFPTKLICGIRKNCKDKKEFALVLKKEKENFAINFIFCEIPADEVDEEFEILLVKEHEEDE